MLKLSCCSGVFCNIWQKYYENIWIAIKNWKYFWHVSAGSGSGSWYYFGFQYQSYISYIEDTHQILFGSSNSFKSYCVHMKSPRTYVHPDIQTNRRTDGRTEIFFCLFCLLRDTNHENLSTGEIFFTRSYLFITYGVCKKEKVLFSTRNRALL